MCLSPLNQNQIQKIKLQKKDHTPNIFHQAHGKISNTIQKYHSSTFKAKEDKVEFFKTLKEIIYKFTQDLIIIDSQLNFSPITCVYHPWIEVKSKHGKLCNKSQKNIKHNTKCHLFTLKAENQNEFKISSFVLQNT